MRTPIIHASRSRIGLDVAPVLGSHLCIDLSGASGTRPLEITTELMKSCHRRYKRALFVKPLTSAVCPSCFLKSRIIGTGLSPRSGEALYHMRTGCGGPVSMSKLVKTTQFRGPKPVSGICFYPELTVQTEDTKN